MLWPTSSAPFRGFPAVHPFPRLTPWAMFFRPSGSTPSGIVVSRNRQAKVMHFDADYVGTRVAALWRVACLHTATHVHS
jgi:hypothetical protein